MQPSLLSGEARRRWLVVVSRVTCTGRALLRTVGLAAVLIVCKARCDPPCGALSQRRPSSYPFGNRHDAGEWFQSCCGAAGCCLNPMETVAYVYVFARPAIENAGGCMCCHVEGGGRGLMHYISPGAQA